MNRLHVNLHVQKLKKHFEYIVEIKVKCISIFAIHAMAIAAIRPNASNRARQKSGGSTSQMLQMDGIFAYPIGSMGLVYLPA